MKQKLNRMSFQTPLGTSKYTYLNRPDDKYDPQNPKWKTDLILDNGDEGLIDKIRECNKQWHGNAKNLKEPIEQDEETGHYILRNVWSKKTPTFCDSTGKVIVPMEDNTNIPQIWSGSKIRLKGEIVELTMPTKGVRLQLSSVQIVDPIGPSADVGFEAVEGGFVAEDVPMESFNETEQSEPTQAANF